MKGVCGILLLGLCAGWATSQFLNNKPYPTYSLENMPDTEFSCREKVLGGYYADPDTQCQMFHICVKVAGIGVQDFRFLCPNGTAFDQDHQICADWEDVDCDAATLYYSSNNFDLYRIGSGLESKSVKYGEDEETFALQRAETGDARLNREHQSQRVNQQRESTYRYNNNNNQQRQNNNNDKEIFKGSSSSNFFNNRNGGKEPEYEEEETEGRVNANQDNDREQKRKIIRKQQHNRRPVNRNNEEQEEKTQRPNRPTGFVNNFAGSYAPTTAKPVSSEPPRRFANRQRVRTSEQPETTTIPATKQTQQYNTINRQSSTPQPLRETENYPSNFPKKQTFAPTRHTDNYPSTIPATNTQYETTKVKQTENYPTTLTQTYPTTFAPKAFQKSTTNQQPSPTTFAPRTNAAYTQIAQQTAQYTKKQPNTQTTQYNTNPPTTNYQNPQQFNKKPTTQYNNNNNAPTTFQQTSTPYTQYTPTVPKITTPTTTPVSRSNRFDETQYDDGSYHAKYDNYDDRRDDEIINTAHSTNIANSKNEFAKNNKASSTTPKPYYEQPRPFSAATPKSTTVTQNFSTNKQAAKPSSSTNNNSSKKTAPKEKNVSYDYAYYDVNVGSEPEYEINTEFEKKSKKPQ